MVIDTLTTYSEWEQSFLAEIEVQPHAVAKGDLFVQKILQIRYDLSEADAIDATEYAGAGDRGVDALFIYPSEVDNIPHAIVVQGKYGTAGADMKVYSEAQKFLQSLKLALTGNHINSSFDKIVGVLNNQGSVYYVIATVEPLNQGQKEDLENIKKIASTDFGGHHCFENRLLTLRCNHVSNAFGKAARLEGDTTALMLRLVSGRFVDPCVAYLG